MSFLLYLLSPLQLLTLGGGRLTSSLNILFIKKSFGEREISE